MIQMNAGKNRPYQKLLREVFQLNLHPDKLGVTNIKKLNHALGNPAEALNNVIHIAGTNGKGSVAWKVCAGLRASGLSTGLFVSPHISCFRERVQVNGSLISESVVETHVPKILSGCQSIGIQASYFEVATTLAFLHFAEQQVDAVVLECGLGGRRDATNIVRPALAIVTSIGLDHTRLLGGSVEKIAAEKAGIIKPNVPVLLGSRLPVDVFTEYAAKANSEVFHTKDFPRAPELEDQITPDGLFDYDNENSHIAACALKVLQQQSQAFSTIDLDVASKAAAATRPPCRFEQVTWRGEGGEVQCVLDVGHNPDALALLFHKVAAAYPGRRPRVVLGLSTGKDLRACLAAALQFAGAPDRLHLVQAAHRRGVPVETLRAAAAPVQITGESGSVKETISTLLEKLVHPDEDVVVICGSTFLMSDARDALGLSYPSDAM